MNDVYPLTEGNSTKVFPLLKLPIDLQLEIYRRVLVDTEPSEGDDDELRLSLRITARNVGCSEYVDWSPEHRGLPGGYHYLTRTIYDIPNSRFCGKCRHGRKHACYRKTRTTYEMATPKVPTDLGLLAVNRSTRQLTVPLFYGGNCVELFLSDGIVPFLEDRGQYARQSMKKLRIQWIILQSGREESMQQQLWERNFAYIRKELTGLRSLVINILDKTVRFPDRLENIDLSMEDMCLQRSNMRWLVALASLRGLSRLHVKLFSAGRRRFHTPQFYGGPAKQEAIIQQYLESKFYQPRIEEGQEWYD